MKKYIVLFFFLLFSLNFAVQHLERGQIAYYEPMEVKITSNDMQNQLDELILTAVINNTEDKNYVLYIMKWKESKFVPLKVFGVIEPSSSVTANIELGVHYSQETYHKETYALVLSDEDKNFKGQIFNVVEDWSSYESSITTSVLKAHLVAVPLITLILIIIIFVLIESAYHNRFKGIFKNEYTTATLFFPKLKGRPLLEKLSDILLNPLFWVLELGFCLVMFSFLIKDAPSLEVIKFEIVIFSGLSAVLFPLIYLGLSWLLNKKPLRFFVSMFMWGMVSAFFAFVLNTLLNSQINSITGMDSTTFLVISAVLVAPIVEELVKELGLVFVSGHHEYDDALTGLMFGFAIGIGFSFMENWFYFTSKTNPLEIGFMGWIQLVLYRSFFNSLAHGCIAGMGGALIGYVKSITHLKKYLFLAFISAFLVAVPLHSLFNLTALMDGGVKAIEQVYGLPFVFNPLFVIILVILFVVTYLLGVRDKNKREGGKHGFFKKNFK